MLPRTSFGKGGHYRNTSPKYTHFRSLPCPSVERLICKAKFSRVKFVGVQHATVLSLDELTPAPPTASYPGRVRARGPGILAGPHAASGRNQKVLIFFALSLPRIMSCTFCSLATPCNKQWQFAVCGILRSVFQGVSSTSARSLQRASGNLCIFFQRGSRILF